jgi:hypothetical protein
LVDGLVPFLEGLRAAGYRLEVGQILAAHGLLARLAERGEVPADLHCLRTVLGPILCASENEQRNFALRFHDWVDSIQAGRGSPPPPDSGRPDVDRAVKEVERLGRAAQRRARPWLVAGAVALAVVAVWMTGLVTSRQDAGPMTTPVPASDGPGGERPKDGPPTPKPKPGFTAGSPEPKADPTAGSPNSKTVTGGGVATERGGSRAATALRVASELGGGFTVFTGVAFEALAAWWLVRRFARGWFERTARRLTTGEGFPGGELVLRRLTADGVPELTALTIRPEDVWPAEARRRLGRAAVGLRRHRRVDTDPGSIDVVATLTRALRAPGRPEPIPAQRAVTPEYLVLVHRVSRRDHQADWADALLDRLAAEQVALVRFDFATDPRVCYPRRDPGPPWSLRDLATRYPDHRLLIFGDASCLCDARTNRPAPWLDRLGAWDFRALLTPLPPAGWGDREEELARLGTAVEPATSSGLEAVAAAVAAAEGAATDLASPDDGEPVPTLPFPLRVDPLRWLDPTPPLPVEAERLTADLRWYLKGDFEWLAACAVYPELRWDLTLELGRVLSLTRGRPLLNVTSLSRLVRLPWFRHGAMPDWLRLRLLKDLPPDLREVIRRAIEQLLLGADRVDAAALEVTGPTLTIARATGGGGGTRGALARGVRRQLAKDHPDGPLNDYVFATFLEGQDPSPLDFRLPAGVRALLHEVPPPLTPIRTASRPSGCLFPIQALGYGLLAVFLTLAGAAVSNSYDMRTFAQVSRADALAGLVIFAFVLFACITHESALTLPGYTARGNPLTNRRFAPVAAWYVFALGLSALAIGLVATSQLRHLSRWGNTLSTLVWSVLCVLVTGRVVRLLNDWGSDRVGTALRFYRTPLYYSALSLALVLAPMVFAAGYQGNARSSAEGVLRSEAEIDRLIISASFSCAGLFLSVGPWLACIYLRVWHGFVPPPPVTRTVGPRGFIPWAQARLRTLVIVSGLAATIFSALPYLYAWWTDPAYAGLRSRIGQINTGLGVVGGIVLFALWLLGWSLKRRQQRRPWIVVPQEPKPERRWNENPKP